MNAIVALCHFCEQHGPSVIMCTQPYKRRANSPNSSSSSSNAATKKYSTASLPRTYSSLGMSSSDNIQVVSEMIPDLGSKSQSRSGMPTHPSCRACSFNPPPSSSLSLAKSSSSSSSKSTHHHHNDQGMVSNDANLSYISTQWPKDTELGRSVQDACFRSLSTEICVESENGVGTFYFGDEVNGHVIAHKFTVKDFEARGQRATYSILVLSWDRVYVLNLWDFLETNLNRMTGRLIKASDKTFAKESTTALRGGGCVDSEPEDVFVYSKRGRGGATNLTRASTPPAASTAGNLNSNRLAVSSQQHRSMSSSGAGSLRRRRTGQGRHQRRAGDADMRSLIDLTRDQQIYYRIHAWFTWLLRTSGRYWTILPSLSSPPDEDLLVDLERLQLLPSSSSTTTNRPSSKVALPTLITALASSNSSIARHLQSPPPSQAPSEALPPDLTDGSCEQERDLSIKILSSMYQSLGSDGFGKLIQHVLVGDQVVVQPLFENELNSMVVNALARLLPKGCISQAVDSPVYLPSFQCTLLGLLTDVKPEQGQEEDDWNVFEPGYDSIAYLAVFRPRPKKTAAPSCYYDHHHKLYPQFTATPVVSDGTSSCGDGDDSAVGDVRTQFANSLKFKLCSLLPAIDPRFNLLRSGSDDSWWSAVPDTGPLLFKSPLPPSLPSRSSQPPPPPPVSVFADRVIQLVAPNNRKRPLPTSTIDLALTQLRQEWLGRARQLMAFKRCQLSSVKMLTSDETSRRWQSFFEAIHCSKPADADIVKFWQRGLSQLTRANTCCHNNLSSSTGPSSRRASCSSNSAIILP